MSGSVPVTVGYDELCDPALAVQVQDKLERAFGASREDALGVVIVQGLPPSFVSWREECLLKAAEFATLGDEVKNKYTDEESTWFFGWSHGKEKMNGRPQESDTLKGSYYNNPSIDSPDVPAQLVEKHPVYYRKNIWPSQHDCPGFEDAFKTLARFMVRVGNRVARACDAFVSQETQEKVSIEELVSKTKCAKARLLHYFPPQNSSNDSQETQDNWCGWHLDHSLLTVLCPAMYLFSPTNSTSPSRTRIMIPSPSAASGLYIKNRSGENIVKVSIPPDCVAVQTGQALEVLCEGRLRATPHCVRAGLSCNDDDKETSLSSDAKDKINEKGYEYPRDGVISRETMAVFLQPDVEEVISQNGETFGEFTHRIVRDHH